MGNPTWLNILGVILIVAPILLGSAWYAWYISDGD